MCFFNWGVLIQLFLEVRTCCATRRNTQYEATCILKVYVTFLVVTVSSHDCLITWSSVLISNHRKSILDTG